MPAGRPSKYPPEVIEAARKYVSTGWIEDKDFIPSIEGLSLATGIHRETLRVWDQDPEKAEFSVIYKEMMAKQGRGLLNGGLGGGFNPAVTKMVLTKHGYSDKIEQDNISSDGSHAPGTISIKGAE